MNLKNNLIIKKYVNLSASVKASMWFAVCNILQKGISFITVPIFTRIMSTEQYGVYSVYQSWYTIIAIFATLNLYYGVFNNGMLKFENERDRFISSLQGLSTLMTIALFVLYNLGRSFWNSLFGLSSLYIYAMFTELLFAPAYMYWSARQKFEYKYKSLVFVTIFIAVGSPLLGVLAVLSTSYKAEARVLSFVFVQVCVGFIFYISNFRKSNKFFSREIWKYALAFNLPLVPHYLSQTVLNAADRIMISNMVGTDKAAIYSVAYNISQMMVLITNAINNSFVPYTYNSLKKENYAGLRKSSTVLVVFIAICTIVVMSLAPEIICIFGPEEYREAIWIIPPVSVSVFFMFLYSLFGNIEFYFERSKYMMWASVSGAILNVILNYFLINAFGYIAAGYTTLSCYGVFVALHYVFYRKTLKSNGISIDLIYNNKFFAAIVFGMLGTVVVMNILYLYTPVRYLCVIIILLTSLVKRRLILDRIREIK